MDSQRLRQTVIGILILVAIAMFWNRGESTVAPEAPRTDSALPSTAEVVVPSPSPPAAERVAADFDYYVLVLSWSPTHCASEQGRGRDDDRQCRSGRPYGFVLHGLWPQHERGYPRDCLTEAARSVDDALLQRMLEISPSAELVEHEWRKHGTCSGLSQRDYFAAAERAFRSISIPPAYRSPARVVTTSPEDVRASFLRANPSLSRDGLSTTCRRNDLAEVWVCLDKALSPRACSKDVRERHCGAREVRVRAVRGDWPR